MVRAETCSAAAATVFSSEAAVGLLRSVQWSSEQQHPDPPDSSTASCQLCPPASVPRLWSPPPHTQRRVDITDGASPQEWTHDCVTN